MSRLVWDVGRAAWAGMIVSGLGWDEDEAGLGRGEGGSERIREDPRGLGRGRVELRLS